MLTENASHVDQILGQKVWADDFVAKPFSMREFLSRVKALLRRASYMRAELTANTGPMQNEVINLSDLTINQVRREVTFNEKPLRLKPKEYDLLVFLVMNKGIALSRDMILERVWGWEYTGGRRTVDVHIRWLREKIEADPAAPRRITTVRGIGYRFEQ
jgi:DNA-binding response OmpR family regulator